jgi:hypothetical protein
MPDGSRRNGPTSLFDQMLGGLIDNSAVGRRLFQKNKLNAYAINSITGTRGADGAITVQFGGCDGKLPNCVPIVPGWNYTVRLYRPRAAILSGKWKFPEPQLVS